MPRKKLSPKFGIVTWWDTHSSDDWADMPTKYTPVVVKTTGWILETPDGVIVLGSRIKGGQSGYIEDKFYGTSQIPRGCVKEIKYLDHE